MVAFTKVDGGRNVGNIQIFALSTCGWCKKTKEFFTSHGIEYSYVDVDTLVGDELNQAKEQQRKFNPRGSFPTIVIDQADSIAGYDEQKLRELIGER